MSNNFEFGIFEIISVFKNQNQSEISKSKTSHSEAPQSENSVYKQVKCRLAWHVLKNRTRVECLISNFHELIYTEFATKIRINSRLQTLTFSLTSNKRKLVLVTFIDVQMYVFRGKGVS